MNYKVVIEQDGDGWLAAIFEVDGTGYSGDVLMTGDGPTVSDALRDLADASTWIKEGV